MDGQSGGQGPNAPWEFKPGETISPTGGQFSTPEAPTPVAPQPLTPTPGIISSEQSPSSGAVHTNTEEDAYQTAQPRSTYTSNYVSWTASEFIAHQKSSSWYMFLAAGIVLFAGIIFLLTRDLITCLVIIFAGIIFGYYAARKPNEQQYRLDIKGLSIGPKHYELDQFRSFVIVPEGAFSSIVLLPLKRFAFAVTIYYDPSDEEAIFNMLSLTLPYEERDDDPLDQLMRRIRF